MANNTAGGSTPRTTPRWRTDEQASASSCQQASHRAYGAGEASCRVGPEAVDSLGRRGRAGRRGARRAGRTASPLLRGIGPEGRRLRHAEGAERSGPPRTPARHRIVRRPRADEVGGGPFGAHARPRAGDPARRSRRRRGHRTTSAPNHPSARDPTQLKLAVRVPIPLPDGLGNTVTLKPDGSYTTHTSTADVTTFGPNYLNQQGLDSSQGGTLTHQLIDSLGQRTDQYTWHGNDGSQITQAPSGTLTQTNADGSTTQQSTSGVVTQTNPDGSSVSYDPSTGTITTSTGGWFGTTTTFNSNGTVTQTSPAGTTSWDSSGNGISTYNTGDGFGSPVSTSEPAPTAPAIPPSISLPHGPNSPAPTPNNQQGRNDSNSAPAPTDTTPSPDTSSLDSGSLDDGVDSGSLDSGSLDSGASFDAGGDGGGDGGGD
ncbi:MAG: hypothetical protein ACLP4R_20325 [Solirubrobacteraceae bacterium]